MFVHPSDVLRPSLALLLVFTLLSRCSPALWSPSVVRSPFHIASLHPLAQLAQLAQLEFGLCTSTTMTVPLVTLVSIKKKNVSIDTQHTFPQ